MADIAVELDLGTGPAKQKEKEHMVFMADNNKRIQMDIFANAFFKWLGKIKQ